jgi:hypothetical protein
MTEQGQLVFRSHAIRRMFQRQIGVDAIRGIILVGEVIEDRPGDLPYPSRLMLGFVNGRPIHVVVADDREAGTTIIVTVYEPERSLWQPSFKRRRKT